MPSPAAGGTPASPHPTPPILTPDEIHALQIYATGVTHTQAERVLGYSARTYRRLLAAATGKLDCRHPIQAVAWCFAARVITPAPPSKRRPSARPVAGFLAHSGRDRKQHELEVTLTETRTPPAQQIRELLDQLTTEVRTEETVLRYRPVRRGAKSVAIPDFVIHRTKLPGLIAQARAAAVPQARKQVWEDVHGDLKTHMRYSDPW